jgi:uncharacterized membrane protein YecN with MAPEG domain
MEYVALITVLILLHYIYLAYLVGSARGRNNIPAPATTGNEDFERHMRVHMNTLEQLIIVLPALWMCAYFFRADVAAILGAVFLIGRILYAIGYVKDPASRGRGMMIGFVALYGAFI